VLRGWLIGPGAGIALGYLIGSLVATAALGHKLPPP
jgi:hypothetical protein